MIHNHTNKSSNSKLRKAFESCQVTHLPYIDMWNKFMDLYKYRKQAKAYGLIINMHIQRFRSQEEYNNFFTNFESASSLYDLRKTYTELQYLWKIWKPFVKSIRRRREFVDIIQFGIPIKSHIKEKRLEEKHDNTLKIKKALINAQPQEYGSHREIDISFDIEFSNKERLFLLQPISIWLLSTYIKRLSSKQIINIAEGKEKDESKYRYHTKELHTKVIIDRGKISVERGIK